MVHHQFYPFTVSIGIEPFEVEVRIRSHKVKDIILGIVKPILPTYIPAFYEDLVKPMLGSKVNIATYFLIISSMGAIGTGFGVIHLV